MINLSRLCHAITAITAAHVKLGLGLTLLVVGLPAVLYGCSVVSYDTLNTSSAIDKQRSNIVTSNRLSTATASTLITAGIDQDVCLNAFALCMEQLKASGITLQDRRSLALLAELYLAKAKRPDTQADGSTRCTEAILRPPIDDYYANAALSLAEQQDLLRQVQQCRANYRHYLLGAIKASYAYLFFDQLRPASAGTTRIDKQTIGHLPTSLDIQTQDIYHIASDLLIKRLYQEQRHIKKQQDSQGDIRGAFDVPIDVQTTTLDDTVGLSNDANLDKRFEFSYAAHGSEALPHLGHTNASHAAQITLHLPRDPDYAIIANQLAASNSAGESPTFATEALYASHDLSFSGLNTVSKREGVGVSYVSVLSDRQTTDVQTLLQSKHAHLNAADPKDRIYQTGNLLLTGVVLPRGDSIDALFANHAYDVKLYNPYRTKTVTILGKQYPLFANFSASYGLWLAENQLSNVSYFSLLSRQQSLVLPQLFMLAPYDPNKRVVIMLHGLASSPATWVSVTNDIFSDQTLRDNYQVWQIFYPTNVPILENRYQIQTLIEAAYAQHDPSGTDRASSHSVLIGHSMGAVIGRMMVSDTDLKPRLDAMQNQADDHQLGKLIQRELDKNGVQNRLQLRQLPAVDTAVFLSAPFRGTTFADRWFTQALRRVIQLPLGLAQTITGNLANIATEGELAANPLGALYLQNGASQLSDQSSFIELTKDIDISNEVTYHSIIANKDSDVSLGIAQLQDDAPLFDLSDGVNTGSDNTASNEPLDFASIKPSNTNPSDASPSITRNTPLAASAEPPLPSGSPIVAAITLSDQVSAELTADVSDGVVPYASAHLEGAASETLITGGHSIQETPLAVLALRQILHQHLQTDSP